MYRYTLSLTSASDGDGWLTPRPGRLIPENDPVPNHRLGDLHIAVAIRISL
jgi:hypothetical protein